MTAHKFILGYLFLTLTLVSNAQEKLFRVNVNGRYSFINEKDEVVIMPSYDYTAPFCNGIAIIYENGLASYINKFTY